MNVNELIAKLQALAVAGHGESPAMSVPLLDRLREVGCDREPFTPDHAQCVCRLTNEAAKTIEELEARLRPGVSEMLNELIAAGMAHVNPIDGEISFTPQGKLLVERTRGFEHRSVSNN